MSENDTGAVAAAAAAAAAVDENPQGSDINLSRLNRDLSYMNEYIAYALRKNNHQKMIAQLPPVVFNKIRCLRKLQLETINLEAEFHCKVYELERKYLEKHQENFNKRNDIINGLYQPSEEECNLPECIRHEMESLNIQGDGADATDVSANGIPRFWLTIFKYVPMFESMVKDCDEQILKHLTDIRIKTKPLPDLSFTLEFYFSPNEFFDNSVLTKEYLMKCSPEVNDPFSFDGPEIYKSVGCNINWKPEKDVTTKKIKMKNVEFMKNVKSESFFDFFSPPEIIEDANDPNFEKVNDLLESDFEIGHYIKERIVPRAILYFTGEFEDDDIAESSASDTLSVRSNESDKNAENQNAIGDSY